MLVLTVGSFSVFGEISEITVNYKSDLAFGGFPSFLFSLYILLIYQGLPNRPPPNRRPPIPGRGGPPYQAGAAWPMPRTGPGRPAHAPPHVRGPWGLRPRGRGGRPQGAPQRGPSTWGGAWAAPAWYGAWARHISIYIYIYIYIAYRAP